MEISTDTLSFEFSKEDEHAVWIDNLSKLFPRSSPEQVCPTNRS